MNRSPELIRFCLILAVIARAYPQPFDSGSKGSDGALVLATPGTLVFDPRTFNPPLNPSGDNVYHFTSIYVAKGITVKLSARLLNGAVFWLSQGPVQIDGTIDLDGADGERVPGIAGAGGFSGGAPGHAGYAPGAFKSNVFLVPLVGGSGGDGGKTNGGGAGGGALLIASSSSIIVNGSITANGGASIDGRGGSGGAIRLVAPTINGSSGHLSARGGQPQGADGHVRFEAFNNQFTGDLNNTPSAQGKPFGLFLPPDHQGSVRLLSLGGLAVGTEEITINKTEAVNVVIEARFIPPGTVIQLEFFPESGVSQTVATTPLEGTFELSRASASIVFPNGLSRLQMKASWKPPAQREPSR